MAEYGSLCRHKKTCRYWWPISVSHKGSLHCCHYSIDRDELRP